MRFLKQLAYASLYLLIFTIVGSAIYGIYFYEAPTCFDNTQNQDELGIDCDGPCISCELKHAILSTENVDILRAGDGKVTLLTKIENSVNYSATFEYKIDIVGSFGTPLRTINGESSINPRSSRYIVIPGVPFDKNDTSRAIIETTNVNWAKEPGIELSAIEVRGLETTTAENEVEITGKIFNGSLDLVKRARVTALLLGEQDEILSASAVDIHNIGVSEERGFTVFFPSIENLELEPDSIRSRIFSEVVPSL